MRRKLTKRLRLDGLSLTIVFGATGCVTGRVSQFHHFAEAGKAYVEASQTVLEEAGTAAIDADSLIAMSGRDALKTAEARRNYILAGDQALHKRLMLLRAIGDHGKRLQCYFESLAELSDPQPTPALEAAAESAYDSVLQLSPAIKNGSLGGSSIQEKIPQATDVVVQSFALKALEDELQRRSKAIERELALQEAAFKAVSENLTTDLTVRLQLQETQDVIDPYAAAAKLPAGWVNRRQSILQARAAADGAQSLGEAAARLRANFVALVENRLSASDILKTMHSIHSVHDFKEAIQKVSH